MEWCGGGGVSFVRIDDGEFILLFVKMHVRGVEYGAIACSFRVSEWVRH